MSTIEWIMNFQGFLAEFSVYKLATNLTTT